MYKILHAWAEDNWKSSLDALLGVLDWVGVWWWLLVWLDERVGIWLGWRWVMVVMWLDKVSWLLISEDWCIMMTRRLHWLVLMMILIDIDIDWYWYWLMLLIYWYWSQLFTFGWGRGLIDIDNNWYWLMLIMICRRIKSIKGTHNL